VWPESSIVSCYCQITLYHRFTPEFRGGLLALSRSTKPNISESVSKATLETIDRPSQGAKVNRSASRPRPLNVARFTEPRQHTGSQQPCYDPQKKTHALFGPPPPLTFESGVFVSAPAATSTFNTSK